MPHIRTAPGSTRTRRLALLLALFVALAPGAGRASDADPRTVSPGALEQTTSTASPCPTFSWTLDETAAGYEIVVMALVAGAEPRAVLHRRIDGRALAWTPDRAACLQPGEYAWSVRALGAADPDAPGEPAWAAPRRFAVPAAPSDAEVAAALETLRRWEAAAAGGPGAPRNSPGTFRDTLPEPPRRGLPSGLAARQAEVGTAAGAALRGDNPASAGEEYGVLGVTSSLDGAGVAAVNRGTGPDLVLDGAATGQADALLREDGIDRPSSAPQSFDIRNTLAGGMTLRVDGVPVVTTATDQDTLGALACVAGEIPLRGSSLWTCAPGTGATYLAGNQLQLTGNTFDVVEGSGSGLDADLFDGLDSAAFSPAMHDHFGQTWIGLAQEGLHLTNGVTTSQARALVGEVVAQDGQAVVGLANAPNGSGTGVLGRVSATSGPGTGVAGEVASPDGRGVVGRATASTGAPRGVYGESASAHDGAGVHGESLPDVGPGAGVLGVAHSFQGAGVVARNLTPGPDLRLDGSSTNATPADLTEEALDRASPDVETFDLRNSGPGVMTLTVDGVPVVTTATDQDVLGNLPCSVGEVAIRQLAGWACAPAGGTAYLAGNQLDLNGSTFDVVEGPGSGLDADTVDGLEPSQIAALGHDHFGQSWTGSDLVGLAIVNQADETGVGLSAAVTSPIASGVGVEGTVVNGAGVAGWAFSTSSESYGVSGRTFSPNGAGVRGEGSRQGVFGVATGGTGWWQTAGITGWATSPTGATIGVFGASSSSNGVGVFGAATGPDAAAGNFWGDVTILGTLSSWGKNFRIDHPLDPENLYLQHSSVESSERLNLYTGNVTLNADGAAWVELPVWFEPLNTDFRYQLTPLGAPSQPWIGQEVEAGRFQVRGAPGSRVSWQVTAVRHDAWAVANPLAVELEKPPAARGRYASPEAFGQPRERGIAWEAVAPFVAATPEASSQSASGEESRDGRP